MAAQPDRQCPKPAGAGQRANHTGGRPADALKAGQAVGLLPDQVPPRGLGVWAPFFGRDAYTMTLSARLAQQTGAQVLLAWGERLPRGRGYVIHVRPLDGPLATDAAVAAAQINTAMQRLVLECPQQYLWGYARYKAPREDVTP
jgi:KDO2-lipid IV(A) lauroyltransferase